MNNTLIANQAAAFAAWKAKPSTASRASLDAACAAVTAAKRAAFESDRKAIIAALRALARAEEWPRCGQGWPDGPAERRHAAVIAAHGGECACRAEVDA